MINFSDKKNRAKLISLELNSLYATLSIQKNLNKQILVFIKNFIGDLEINLDFDPTNKVFTYMNKSTLILNKSNNNIKYIQKLIKNLKKIDELFQTKNLSSEDLKKKLTTYNLAFNKYINQVYKNTNVIEKFIHEISLLDLSKLLNSSITNTTEKTSKTKKSAKNKTSEKNIDTISSNDITSSFIENTLIISETNKQITLPYNIKTVKEILLNNTDTYSSISDVIKKVYTKPLSYYKFSSFARFKEAYNLMIKKEKSSKLKALSLATELFANFNLHPAIITACKNLDELDIYLACLEDNTLEDFHFFDIKYEIPPVLVTNSNKKELNKSFEII